VKPAEKVEERDARVGLSVRLSALRTHARGTVSLALPRPKPGQLQLQRLERRDARRLRAAPSTEQLVASSGEGEREGFERLQARIDQLDVRNALVGVDGEFLDAVEGGRGRGEDFGDPVGREVESGGIGHFGHARAAPAGEVGDENVGAKVQFGLVQDDPSAGAAAPAMKGVTEHHAEQRGDRSVWPTRARLRVQLSSDDLADDVPRQREEIVVSGAARGDVRHDSPSPKTLQIELHHLERLGTYDVIAAMSRQQYPVFALESVGFEGLVERIEKPQVRNAGAGVERELLGAVEAARGRGKDLAHPVRSDREKALAWRCGQSFTPPAGDVGHDDVFDQMELGLVQDPPPTGPAVPELHAREQRRAERGGTHGVGNRWSWTDVQLSIHEFTDQLLGQRHEIIVGRGAPSRQRHAPKVARRWCLYPLARQAGWQGAVRG
jgi:hypothetical protein